jgi:hypothetical protein
MAGFSVVLRMRTLLGPGKGRGPSHPISALSVVRFSGERPASGGFSLQPREQ